MRRGPFYRNWVKGEGLVSFELKVKETDLMISAERDLSGQARDFVLKYRRDIEDYIEKEKDFYTSLDPIPLRGDAAPPIVKAMIEASAKAGVGPMAAVAGAIAEFTGRDLLRYSKEVIVENGGDIFMKTSGKRTVGVFAGDSPFSGRLAIELEPAVEGIGVCTSSGTVGHSLSFGNADAAVIISTNTALADAAATATCNRVKDGRDLEGAIDFAKSVEGVEGALVIIKDKMASWGNIKIGAVPGSRRGRLSA